MGFLDRWRGMGTVQRTGGLPSGGAPISLDEWASYFTYNSHQYPLGLTFSMGPSREEEISPTFAGYVQQAYQQNGAVFACLLARASLFSEARFQWQEFRKGRPGPLFGDTSLEPLENPWPNGTTGDLIVRLEQDYSLAGNFYGTTLYGGLTRMRPDWVTIVLGSNTQADDPNTALDARIIGYIYHPGGKSSGNDPIALDVRDVCHFTGPTPDPTARFRGTSWLTSILAEVQSDKTAVAHKTKFFEHGGSKLAVSVDIPDPAEFQEFVSQFKANNEGSANAYKTLFFNSAMPQTSVIGADMVQMDFKAVQGHGETRIAAAAGVPPVIVGFSEGLEAATYSNYQLAMRRFADLTARPMWRMMAACFESVLQKPQTNSRLWYDDRDIAALKDDIDKRADVQTKQASAAKLLIDAGYEPDSVTDALTSDDFSRLKHSGLTSVQLQEPGTNGNGSVADKAEQILTP